jgi:GNAT superfamily N-acetyltransferase
MREQSDQMRQATTAKVCLDLAKSGRFTVPVLSTAGFNRPLLALSTICRCPSRSKERSWPRNRGNLANVGRGDAVVIAGGLRDNEAQAGYSDWRPLAILVRDPQTKAVAGGLLGRTSLGLLRVDQFFFPEGLRRNRLGGRILAMAEDEARRRSCTRAVLSMVHFQAPGFYLKQGWEVAARIDCEPPGHTRFYMTKKLS